MKFWKKLSYWQKGGIISLLIYPVSYLIFISLRSPCNDLYCGFEWLYLIGPANIILLIFERTPPVKIFEDWLSSIALTRWEPLGFWILILLNLLVYGMIGALIGFVISKIKKKKSV